MDELTDLIELVRELEDYHDQSISAVELATLIWNKGSQQDRLDAFIAILPIARRVCEGVSHPVAAPAK